MLITDAYVCDPRVKGKYADPILELKIDDVLEEIAPPVEHGQHWTVTPCGPFLAVEYSDGYHEGDDSPEAFARFNTTGLYSEQLVPVQVFEADGSIQRGIGMPVARARRLMRKYKLNEWDLSVSEPHALRGRLQWRLELKREMCYGGAVPFGAHCMSQPTKTIVHNQTHLTLCIEHLKSHQDRMRNTRMSA